MTHETALLGEKTSSYRRQSLGARELLLAILACISNLGQEG